LIGKAAGSASAIGSGLGRQYPTTRNNCSQGIMKPAAKPDRGLDQVQPCCDLEDGHERLATVSEGSSANVATRFRGDDLFRQAT